MVWEFQFLNPLEEPLGPRPSLRALLHGQSPMSARNLMSSLCITAHSHIYSGEDNSQLADWETSREEPVCLRSHSVSGQGL